MIDLIDDKHEQVLGRMMAKDESGLFGPIRISSGHRTIPKSGSPPGGDVGEVIPNFYLKNQFGDLIDFREDKGRSKYTSLEVGISK